MSDPTAPAAADATSAPASAQKTSFLVWLERDLDPGFEPITRPPGRVEDRGGFYWEVVPAVPAPTGR